jgi:glucose-6-phosphate 1-dehydrogenase
MRLEMMTKEPGPGGLRLSPTGLDISFEKTFGLRYPDAYERLLMDTVRGNATLFMRRDEVEAAWKIVGSILKVTESAELTAPHPYPAGTWGPAAADELLATDHKAWRRL